MDGSIETPVEGSTRKPIPGASFLNAKLIKELISNGAQNGIAAGDWPGNSIIPIQLAE